MEYRRFGNTCAVRIDAGEDLMEKMREVCEKEQIRLGRVEAIGATDQAVIGVYDREKREYYPEKIDEFMEITSLNGNITICTCIRPWQIKSIPFMAGTCLK